jgi:phosphatidylserine/phosphatidylglycerophosphate/cardiolipin synthase-like enzyme
VLTGPNPRSRQLVERLVHAWREQPEVTGGGLALALRSAKVSCDVATAEQSVDFLWTGPTTPAVPVRRHDQALLGIIADAQESLTVVSYAVFGVAAIVDALTGAVERGVRVRVVLEFRGAEGGQTFDPLKALKGLDPRIDVFHWPFEKRPVRADGKRGYIHVKCAVADARVAFISSANLTSYALEANMELGVLIEGGALPARIAEHFDRLILGKVLERYER